MATKFDKVRLATIEQGQFLEAAEAAFQDVAKQLIEHIETHTHGSDELKAKFTAAVELAAKVSVEFSKGVFHIKTDIAKKLPKRPSGLTTALCSEDPEDADALCLFSQVGGTREGDPRQMPLPLDTR